MTITITTEEVVAALKQAVADRGADFNYREHYGIGEFDTCHYVEPGTDGRPEPGCLVGHVLHKSFGIPLEAFAAHEGDGVDELGFLPASDRAVVDILSEAQVRQDSGETWGEAVEGALAKVR